MGTSRTKIAAIAALSTIWPGIALPQQGGTTGSTTTTPGTATTAATTGALATTPAAPTGGIVFDIGISSKLSFDDNFQLRPNSSGNSSILDNRLTFNLSSVTGVQDFSINASGVFRFADIPGRSISGFEDPTIRLRYVRDGVNNRLTLTGRYRNVDREFLDPFQVEQEEQNAGIFIDDGGTVIFKNAALTYQTGINNPLGFTFGLSHDAKDYSNVTNPRLFDTRTDSADVTATLKLSPVTQLRLQAGLTEFSADDADNTDRRTVDYAIGVVQDINPVLVLDAQLGWTEVDTDKPTATPPTPVSSQRSGATGAVKLTQTLGNGSVFGSLDSTLNQNGTRTTMRFGRDLQLRSGTLNATIGGVHTPGGNTHVIASVGYVHQLKTSDISVSLNRGVSTNSNSEDILDTRLTVGYGHEINNNSRFDLALNWGRSESDVTGVAPTIDRTSLRASYSRALTQDWDLTGGVLIRYRDDSSATGSAQSNSVFLTLDRRFSFRP